MFKTACKFVLVSLIAGFFAAVATGLYSSLVSQVTTDHAAGRHAQIISILQEISGKLSKTTSRSVDIGVEITDQVRPGKIDFTKLFIAYDPPEYQGRAFGIGRKQYRTSFSIKGFDQAKIFKENIIRIEWDYLGQRATTFKEAPLFLTNINLNFEIKAKVWLDKKLEKQMELPPPLLLKTRVVF